MPEPVSRRQLPSDFDDPRTVEGADASQRAPRAAIDDPLVELARILGETTGFATRPEVPAETARRGDAPARTVPQQLSALEAELFDELRASVTPDIRVRGEFEREVTPPIPQHPVDDRDIASLRIGAARAEPEPPRSAEGTEAQWSDFYAYDDGVAAGSYDPAFATAPEPAPVYAPQPAEPGRAAPAARHQPAYPHATFDEFGREEIAAAAREATPLVAAEPRIMPHSREEERAAASLPHEESGRGLKIAVAAIALVLVGGGALAAWKFTGGSGSGEPVLLRADGKPLKTVPEAKAPTADAGPTLTPDDPKAASRIVSKQEDPVDQVSGRTAEGKEVRLINPGAQRPTSDVPHTVKTVVVRPDGSIVSDGVALRAAKPTEPPAEAPAPPMQTTATPPVAAVPPQAPPPSMAGAQPMAGQAPIQPEPTPVATRVPTPKPAPVDVAPETPAPVVAAPKVKTVTVTPVTTTPVTAAKPAPRTPAPAGGAPLSLGPVSPKLAATPPAPAAPAAPPAAAPKPVATAPVSLAPPPAAGGGGDYLVQISASGSDAAARASFSAAQRKYSALAGKSVDVQRADLGSKGVYYRARVPAGSREQAAALCSQLKAQGGDCMVVRR
jgi:hypothetical protein